MDDQQKTQLFNGFSNIVRQSQLPGLDVQRLSMAFRMTVDALEPGQPIELQSLHDYLTNDQKVPPQSALELCVILKAREGKLGVIFTPTAKQAALSPEAAAKIASAFATRVDKSDFKSTPGTPAWKSTPGTPAWKPAPVKKGGAPKSKIPVFVGILVVTVAAAVGFFAWRQGTMQPPLQEVPVTNVAGGLVCAKLISDGKTAICEIPVALYQGLGQATLVSQAMTTKGGLSGVQTLMVRTAEDQRTVLLK